MSSPFSLRISPAQPAVTAEDPRIPSRHNSMKSNLLKLQLYPFIWRHVQLRLSYERHWTKHNEVPVLSISRHRLRSFFSEDSVLLDQIVLDSNTRLLTPSSRDLLRLRFTIQNGGELFCFQAHDEVTYENWRVTIVNAITEAEEIEQRLQKESFTRNGEALTGVDRDQAKVYARDATNYKFIRLHQSATFMATTKDEDDYLNCLRWTLHVIQSGLTAEVGNVVFSHLFEAVEHECAVDSHRTISCLNEPEAPSNQGATKLKTSTRTATISDEYSHFQKQLSGNSSASTCTSSDWEDEVLDLSQPRQTQVHECAVFPSIHQWGRTRPLTAREILLRHRMEKERHGGLPCRSSSVSKQPEEELEGMLETRNPEKY